MNTFVLSRQAWRTWQLFSRKTRHKKPSQLQRHVECRRYISTFRRANAILRQIECSRRVDLHKSRYSRNCSQMLLHPHAARRHFSVTRRGAVHRFINIKGRAGSSITRGCTTDKTDKQRREMHKVNVPGKMSRRATEKEWVLQRATTGDCFVLFCFISLYHLACAQHSNFNTLLNKNWINSTINRIESVRYSWLSSKRLAENFFSPHKTSLRFVIHKLFFFYE